MAIRNRLTGQLGMMITRFDFGVRLIWFWNTSPIELANTRGVCGCRDVGVGVSQVEAADQAIDRTWFDWLQQTRCQIG
jgi:hypothetical protein